MNLPRDWKRLVLGCQVGEAVSIDGQAVVQFEAIRSKRLLTVAVYAPATTKVLREKLIPADAKDASGS